MSEFVMAKQHLYLIICEYDHEFMFERPETLSSSLHVRGKPVMHVLSLLFEVIMYI